MEPARRLEVRTDETLAVPLVDHRAAYRGIPAVSNDRLLHSVGQQREASMHDDVAQGRLAQRMAELARLQPRREASKKCCPT